MNNLLKRVVTCHNNKGLTQYISVNVDNVMEYIKDDIGRFDASLHTSVSDTMKPEIMLNIL